MIYRSRSGRDRKILAAFAGLMAMSASTAAMADCNGTGIAPLFAPILPFSTGAAVSSLVSAINTANTAFLTQSSAFVSAPGNPRPDQEGGGVWGRAVGGDITTKNTTTTSNIAALGIPIPGTVTCNTKTNLQFAGVQLGTDVARLNWNGWNVHVGTTVGYLGARARDVSAPGVIDPSGGTFRDTLQVPFAGVYAAVTKGGFFVDGQVRLDYYQNSLNDPPNSPLATGLFEQKLDARGVAVTANVGYNQALQNNWFIEPSAGIVASRVKVDPLNVTGTIPIFAPGAGVTFPGQLQIDDLRSTLGRLSLRTGTSIASGNMIWQPFAIASVYHEFERNSTASFGPNAFSNFVGFPTSGNITTSGIGTYGQVGVAAQVVGTGLLGYIRGDYRFGDSIDGYSINGGVRYQFTPEVVNAPMYAKAPILKAPMLVQAYNWTGWFIGASGGVHNGSTRWTFDNATIANPRFAGGLGGIQAGYDHQFGRWVVGVEGNINATNARGARPCPAGDLFTCEVSMSYIGTATARLGYALTDRSLYYIRGGGAFDNTRITTNCNTGPFQPVGVGLILIGCGESQRRDRAGYTVGFGSEFALTQNWTARGETNFYDMGTRTYTLPSSGVVDVRERGFVSTVGVYYRFGGPIVARY